MFFRVAVVLSLFICQVTPQELSSLKQRALNLSAKLEELFEEATSFTTLQEGYSNITAGGEVKLLNGTEIVENISRALAEDFAVLTDVLKETVKQVELVYLSHVNTSCCSPGCVLVDEVTLDPDEKPCSEVCPNATDYYRAQVPVNETAMMDDDLELVYNTVFGSQVNLSTSALHVPVDIYEQDPLVQCFVEWSDNLTPIFQQNQLNFTQQLTQQVSFQYFGSDTGLLRIYPARDWSYSNPCHRCPFPPKDTFSVHRSPWYRNTVSGNKLVIILLDMSGSMTGFRLLLAKLTVQQLLKSLTQNDYFFVIRVAGSNKTGHLGCFNGTVRATPENVLVMNEVVHSLSSTDVRGRADFKEAIKMAAMVFTNRTECHKTLVVMTDSDADSAVLEDALNMHNNDREFRVFPFMVVGSSEKLKTVACNFRGRLYMADDYNQILPAVKMFFDDLRQLSLPVDEERKEVFWNHYRGLEGDLVLTGSSPLFSHKNNNQTDSEFLGVVGIDVNLDSIAELFQPWNLEELAYGFLMDSNGQLLIHPQIDKEYIAFLPPDGLINLDVSQFEGVSNSSGAEFDSIRRAMLNRERGQQTLETWLPIERGKHYRLRNVTYFYAPVEGTPYSIAIVLPSGTAPHQVNDQILLGDINEHLEDCRMFKSVLLRLDNRPYYHGVLGMEPTEDAKMFIDEELLSNIKNTSPANCNSALVYPLLVDLNVSIALMERLFEIDRTKRRAVFFQYTSGLTYCSCYYDDDDMEARSSCPTQTQPFMDLTMVDTSNNSSLFVYSNDSTLYFIKRLVANYSSSTGLLGTALRSESIPETLIEQLTLEEDVTTSYVIDSSGYIVTSSIESDLIGRKFATIEPSVFEDMVAMEAYLVGEMCGYELRPCNLTLTTNTTGCLGSSAYSVYQGVLLSLLKWMVWTLNGGLWITLKLIMLSILGSIQSFTGWNVMVAVDAAAPDHPPTGCQVDLCLETVQFYELNDQFEETGVRHVNCSNADTTQENIWYEAVRVQGTNLVLVVVNDSCSSNNTITEHQYGRQECPIPCVCECDRRSDSLEKECHVYRRPMDESCNANTTVQLECSSANSYRTTSWFLFYVIISQSVLTRILPL